MNATLKTVLLTVLTLSLFTIAMIEISGISNRALFNKFGITLPSMNESEGEKTMKENQDRDTEASKLSPTTISWVDSVIGDKPMDSEVSHDFGTIIDGDKPKHTYTFTNTGTKPLMISSVIPGCGCTTPSFTKELIMPGKQGEVTIEFNSSGKSKDGGIVKKNVLINANVPMSPFAIHFKATVKPK